MAQVTTDILTMQSPLINTKKIAILVAAFYVFSAVRIVRALNHRHQMQFSERMPIVMGVGYVACIYFFLEIQRGTKNIFEKITAFASAGAFTLPLVRLVCGQFRLIPPTFLTSLYLDAALTVIATSAIIARTLELLVIDHKSSPHASA
jgi:hypothetical protein